MVFKTTTWKYTIRRIDASLARHIPAALCLLRLAA